MSLGEIASVRERSAQQANGTDQSQWSHYSKAEATRTGNFNSKNETSVPSVSPSTFSSIYQPPSKTTSPIPSPPKSYLHNESHPPGQNPDTNFTRTDPSTQDRSFTASPAQYRPSDTNPYFSHPANASTKYPSTNSYSANSQDQVSARDGRTSHLHQFEQRDGSIGGEASLVRKPSNMGAHQSNRSTYNQEYKQLPMASNPYQRDFKPTHEPAHRESQEF